MTQPSHAAFLLPSPRAEEFAPTVLMKFGGSSVVDPARIAHVAKRLIAAKERGLRVVGVVSAMGDTTDELLTLAHEGVYNTDPRLVADARKLDFVSCSEMISWVPPRAHAPSPSS